MLRLVIKGPEAFDEATNRFSYPDSVEVELEHSLVSLSKWEAIHQIPFLGDSEKTPEQLMDYIKFMVVTPDFDMDKLYNMDQDNLDAIQAYLDSKQSATTFSDVAGYTKPTARAEVITSELIYYWMTAAQISFECETWNLHRLFNLLRILSIKNSKGGKVSAHEQAQKYRDLNAQRRAKYGTRG